jgi:hypothetical protein
MGAGGVAMSPRFDRVLAGVLASILGAAVCLAQTPFGPALIEAGPVPRRIATGDLDGDARSDLVTASTSDTIRVFRSNGGGAFSRARLGVDSEPLLGARYEPLDVID